MKKLLQSRTARPYLITYLIWLVLLLLIILNSTTEDGAPYPVGTGIALSVISAFVFSAPIWVVQFVWIWWRARLQAKKEECSSALVTPDAALVKDDAQGATTKPISKVVATPQPDSCPENKAQSPITKAENDAAIPSPLGSPTKNTVQGASPLEPSTGRRLPSRPHRSVHAAQALRLEEKRQRRAAAQKRIHANLALQEEARAAAASYREKRIQATGGMGERQLLVDAIRLASSKMFLSEKTMKTEYPCLSDQELHKLLAVLVKLGVLQQRSNGAAWLSLLNQRDAQALIESLHGMVPGEDNTPAPPQQMDGHQFEQYCADLLAKNGYANVEVTKASGDFGIDVLAEKDGVTYAIQCKYYTDKVGNHAVQEAFAGKEYYDRMVAVVMTNSTFAAAAVETAKETHVLLWDGSMMAK